MNSVQTRRAIRDRARAWLTKTKHEIGTSMGNLQRMRHGLGGSHTVVTYPPLDALEEISARDVIANVRPTRSLNLYAHLPFCEFICPFCHYLTKYTVINRGGNEVDGYLHALRSELKRWKRLIGSSRLDSLYVGGGTPTVLKTADLIGLLGELLSFSLNDGFQASIETSPLTATAKDGRQKLRDLVDAGITRVSMGLQSFDPEILRATRNHDPQAVVEALWTLKNLNAEINVDMIQELPHQTEDSLLDDIVRLAEFRPHQVTWYLLRLHEGSHYHRLYSRGDLDLPTAAESEWRRLLVREGMRLIGYEPRPGGRFVLRPGVNDRFKDVRSGTDSTLLGIGASAYSHGWGYLFRNTHSGSRVAGIHAYTEQINANNFAIAEGMALSPLEQTASRLVAGIRHSVALPEAREETAAYLTDVRTLLSELRSGGFVDTSESGHWSMTEMGFLFEEEICSLFYSLPIKARLRVQSDLDRQGRVHRERPTREDRAKAEV